MSLEEELHNLRNMSEADRDALLRELLFVPCETKEHLRLWVMSFLGLDLPSVTVCHTDPDFEPSNSNPLDLLWEVYEAARKGDRNKTRFLFYAARGTYKSVVCSVAEALCLFHLRRDVGHMAANKSQSKIVQGYLKAYLQRPVLRDFMTSKNESEVSVTWYENSSGEILTPDEYKELQKRLPDASRLYVEKTYKTTVVVATLGGTNGLHVSMMCVDGSTQLLVEASGDGSRSRKKLSARGLFNSIIGLGSGGAPLGPSAPSMGVDCSGEQKILSMNLQTGTMEFCPVTHAIRRRSPTLIVSSAAHKIVCSPDHPVWVMEKGFIQASEVRPGDVLPRLNRLHNYGPNKTAPLQTTTPHDFSEAKGDEWEQVLLGTLLGDAGIYRRNTSNPYIHIRHCKEQGSYCEWKRKVLSNKLRFIRNKSAVSGYTGEQQVAYSSGNSPYLLPYLGVRKLEMLDKLGSQGLAVWYMDDGWAGNGFRLSTECWTETENQKICDFLNARFGLRVLVAKYSRGDKTYFYCRGGVEAKKRLAELCAPFVHPDLAYKFNLTKNKGVCRACGGEYWYFEAGTNALYCTNAVCQRIRSGGLNQEIVETVSDGGMRWVYDFTVEGNHNFWGNGFLNKNCMDELDLTSPQVISEAAMIPNASPETGYPAIVLTTSSRKFAMGPVQVAIDNAHKTNTHVRHWNVIDVTRGCPTERHLPNRPKLPVYYSDKHLTTIEESEWKGLPPEAQSDYKPDVAYEGCVKNCKIFAMCRGRLATQQTGSSPLLKDVHDTQDLFLGQLDVEKAQAQLLCRKPSREGMVYPRLSAATHLIPAHKMAEIITGEPHPTSFGKEALFRLFAEHEVKYYAGLDHGYSHCFAGSLGVVWKNVMFVVDAFEVPGLELDGKIAVLDNRFKRFNPVVYPDTSSPADNKTIARHGYRVKKVEKGPGSVVGGIGIVRMKLSPVLGSRPELYFLKGDAGVEQLFDRLLKYAWVIDAETGNPTDVPREIGDDGKAADDGPDALRYMVMSVFAPRGHVRLAADQAAASTQAAAPAKETQERHQHWQQISDYVGLGSSAEEPVSVPVIKKKGIVFDLG